MELTFVALYLCSFIVHIGRKRFDNLVTQYQMNGLYSRLHGNSKRLPANTISVESTEMVTTFITNYGRSHGLPLPGRVSGHRDKVIVLPSDITKAYVYDLYKKVCSDQLLNSIGRSKFYALWQEILPHISISKLSSDLCYTCQKNRQAIQLSAPLSDEDKTSLLLKAQDHLAKAKAERDYYNIQVE